MEKLKYFAKFLPPEDSFRRVIKNNESIIIIDFEEERKLFLCSWDVKVSDECYHQKYPEIGKWAIKEGGIEDCVDWHGENVDQDDLYKVIGKINPLLTDIKEGDEWNNKTLPYGILNI